MGFIKVPQSLSEEAKTSLCASSIAKQSFLSWGSSVNISASFCCFVVSRGVTLLGIPGSTVVVFCVFCMKVFCCNGGRILEASVPGFASCMSLLSYKVIVVWGGKHLVSRFFDIANALKLVKCTCEFFLCLP